MPNPKPYLVSSYNENNTKFIDLVHKLDMPANTGLINTEFSFDDMQNLSQEDLFKKYFIDKITPEINFNSKNLIGEICTNFNCVIWDTFFSHEYHKFSQDLNSTKLDYFTLEIPNESDEKFSVAVKISQNEITYNIIDNSIKPEITKYKKIHQNIQFILKFIHGYYYSYCDESKVHMYLNKLIAELESSPIDNGKLVELYKSIDNYNISVIANEELILSPRFILPDNNEGSLGYVKVIQQILYIQNIELSENIILSEQQIKIIRSIVNAIKNGYIKFHELAPIISYHPEFQSPNLIPINSLKPNYDYYKILQLISYVNKDITVEELILPAFIVDKIDLTQWTNDKNLKPLFNSNKLKEFDTVYEIFNLKSIKQANEIVQSSVSFSKSIKIPILTGKFNTSEFNCHNLLAKIISENYKPNDIENDIIHQNFTNIMPSLLSDASYKNVRDYLYKEREILNLMLYSGDKASKDDNFIGKTWQSIGIRYSQTKQEYQIIISNSSKNQSNEEIELFVKNFLKNLENIEILNNHILEWYESNSVNIRNAVIKRYILLRKIELSTSECNAEKLFNELVKYGKNSEIYNNPQKYSKAISYFEENECKFDITNSFFNAISGSFEKFKEPKYSIVNEHGQIVSNGSFNGYVSYFNSILYKNHVFLANDVEIKDDTEQATMFVALMQMLSNNIMTEEQAIGTLLYHPKFHFANYVKLHKSISSSHESELLLDAYIESNKNGIYKQAHDYSNLLKQDEPEHYFVKKLNLICNNIYEKIAYFANYLFIDLLSVDKSLEMIFLISGAILFGTIGLSIYIASFAAFPGIISICAIYLSATIISGVSKDLIFPNDYSNEINNRDRYPIVFNIVDNNVIKVRDTINEKTQQNNFEKQ